MSLHSPAPWSFEWNEDAQCSEISSGGLVVACVYDPGDEWLERHTGWDLEKEEDVRESVQANVELLTAAPELLYALDLLLSQTVDMDLAYGIELTAGEVEARQLALNAIAKATNKEAPNSQVGC